MPQGPPRADHTRTLDARRWTFFTQQEEPFVLVWGADGRVEAIDATDAVASVVVHSP